MAVRRKTKTGGRVKGTPNKRTKLVNEMVLTALDKAGGVKYLMDQSEQNPTAFMNLVGKLMPRAVELSGSHDELPLVIYHNYAGKRGHGDGGETEA